MMEAEGISDRLTSLRETVFGPRGRAKFARALGISPSTYNYYEKGRQPPADLLGRAAELTGVRLDWLLTGRGEPFTPGPQEAGDMASSHPLADVLSRFTRHIGSGPEAAAARAALEKLLQEILAALPDSACPAWRPQVLDLGPTSVPILARTAAGITAKWDAFFRGEQDPDALEGLLEGLEGRSALGREADLRAVDPQHGTPASGGVEARLIQLSEPTPDGIAEFLDLPWLESHDPALFGLRVDGDSMAPRIQDGDVVVCRVGAEPLPGGTAVAKLRGRIGVTVKLWRAEGGRVHLIPINELYETTVCGLEDVVWAWRVLWVVRL